MLRNGWNANQVAMKSTNRVVKIPVFPFGIVNAHLIRGERGSILVDAGVPGSEKKIQRALHLAGLSFKDIKLIVVTHAHVDHAGSAASIRELSGAPIIAHAGDAMHYSGEIPMTFCPTAWVGRVFLRTGIPKGSYKSFAPDILLSGADSFDLQDYGFQGQIRSTPGHTAGSISVELSDQEALVGDLVASGILLGGIALKGRAKRPPFEDDPMLVARELQRMVNSGVTHFYMGHGGPLPAKEVKRHIASLLKIAAKSNQCGNLASAKIETKSEPMKTVPEQNKKLVLEAFDTLFNARDYAAAEKFWSPEYIQHSAHIEQGRDGLFNLVKTLPATLKWEYGVVLAEDDFVIVHSRYSGHGLPAPWIVADIVRMENGVLAEHWDVIQDEATKEQSQSGLPMFGASFANSDHPPAVQQINK